MYPSQACVLYKQPKVYLLCGWQLVKNLAVVVVIVVLFLLVSSMKCRFQLPETTYPLFPTPTALFSYLTVTIATSVSFMPNALMAMKYDIDVRDTPSTDKRDVSHSLEHDFEVLFILYVIRAPVEIGKVLKSKGIE